MKKIYLIIISLLLFNEVKSQNFWQSINDPCLWASTQAMIGTSTGRILASGCSPARYTDNSGTNWSSTSGILNGTYIYKFAIAPDNAIYACTSFGLYKSVNNGTAWTKTNANFSEGLSDIAFTTNGDLYIIGTYAIFKSTDGGTTIDTLTKTFSYPKAISIAINSSNQIFIGTNWHSTGGKVYRSDDLGLNWTPMSGTYFSSVSVTELHIKTDGTIFAATAGMGVNRSTDNGVSWQDANTDIPSGTSSWIESLVFNSYGHVYISVGYVGVFKSTNNGMNWTNVSSGLQTSGATVRTPNALAVNPTGYLFAGTNDFGTYRSGASTNITGIKNMSENISSNCFPNPFTSTTALEFSLAQEEDVVVKLLNAEGKEIKTLMKERKPAGKITVVLDGTELKQGIYYYIIQGSNFSSAKILVKE